MERLTRIGSVAAVNAAQVSESPIGLGFEKLDRDVFDPEKAYDRVAALGVKWIRIQSGWQKTERSPGVYDFAWLDRIVANLRQRGLRPWLCLCYGNPLYTPAAAQVFGAVGCPPIATPGEREAWARYVTAVTSHFRGQIGWYEVWNEPDGVWCWKHGPSGREYGEFVKATAAAIRAGDPTAKVIGGSTCVSGLGWLNEVFATGAGACMDALTYHAYSPDEVSGFARVGSIRALCRLHNPRIEIIQGETGAQSRSDGAGAMARAAWTPQRQARFLARHMLADLLDEVKFASYFSCLDMIEALNGTVGDKQSYLDYGYFGVLGADFDADGVSTGAYTPKPSYRTLQVIAAIFRESFTVAELPIQPMPANSPRLLRWDDGAKDIVSGGFRKPDGATAFAYWKPTELLTTTYEGTISLEVAGLRGEARLIDIEDGGVYRLPAAMVAERDGHRLFRNLPLLDRPLLLTFGEFAEIGKQG